MSSYPYETKTQVLLNILLSDVEESLELSDQRMRILAQHKDFDSLEVERQTNALFKEKKEKILFLIDCEKNSASSYPTVVQIGTIYPKKGTKIEAEYISELTSDSESDNWTLTELTEEQIQKILDTEPRKIEESDVFNDIHLSKEESLKHARKILDTWKNKDSKQ